MSKPFTVAEEAEIAEACRCAPAWITPTVVRGTLEVWRPLYGGKLTVAGAIEICINVEGGLEILIPKGARLQDDSSVDAPQRSSD